MKLVFILVLTAFTVCLSREIHRHRHEEKFLRGERDAYIGPQPGVEHNRLSQNMEQISDILEKLSMD